MTEYERREQLLYAVRARRDAEANRADILTDRWRTGPLGRVHDAAADLRETKARMDAYNECLSLIEQVL